VAGAKEPGHIAAVLSAIEPAVKKTKGRQTLNAKRQGGTIGVAPSSIEVWLTVQNRNKLVNNESENNAQQR
jgi:hypothetical protein